MGRRKIFLFNFMCVLVITDSIWKLDRLYISFNYPIKL